MKPESLRGAGNFSRLLDDFPALDLHFSPASWIFVTHGRALGGLPYFPVNLISMKSNTLSLLVLEI